MNDPRRKQGKRFSITAIVLLALAAILSNHVSELAIAEWGAGQSTEVKQTVGFANGVTPHQSTIHRLFRKLSAEELAAAFRRILLHIFPKEEEPRGTRAVAIDGKAQRGRLKFEEEHGYAVHAVSVVDHQMGIVLTQGHVEKTDVAPRETPPDVATASKLTATQEQQEAKKQKSELAAASRLIQH
ncbi:MAG TPA: transposase family protein [Ktedonobacteraceae bacterium]|nr:transposase family protein [Ktedonobacteraceae bacterium]